MEVNLQDNMFGEAQPVFDDCPGWLEPYCQHIWAMYHGGEDTPNTKIMDDDNYLQMLYWIKHDGLGEALPADAINAFALWYTRPNRVTPPETLRRARQWLTQDRPGGAVLPQSPEAKARRDKKARQIRNQMGE